MHFPSLHFLNLPKGMPSIDNQLLSVSYLKKPTIYSHLLPSVNTHTISAIYLHFALTQQLVYIYLSSLACSHFPSFLTSHIQLYLHTIVFSSLIPF